MLGAAATRSSAAAITRPLDDSHWLDVRHAIRLANETGTQLRVHGVTVLPKHARKPLPPGLHWPTTTSP